MTMLSSDLRSRADVYSPLEGLGTAVNGCKNLMKCVYDFSVLGGAVGTIGLLDDLGNKAILPANAIITRAFIKGVTALTSGGAATVAVEVEAAADLRAATAFGSVTGLLEGVPVGSAATMVTLTAQRQVSAVIAAAALTAGKFNVYLEFVLV